MKFEIKSHWTGAVIFALETESMKLCVEAAVKSGADLSGANLSGADLSGANLSGAYLSGANLSGAYLSGANLRGAYLSGANLRGANLRGAYLSGAYLSDAYLSDAYLRGANLSGADLSDANLSGADLSDANLSGAKGADAAIAKTRILPEGAIIGWKKAQGHIVKLLIPAEAKRSHAFGRKCRAEFADVLEIEGAEVVYTNNHGPKTEYRVGQRVTPDKWDENWQEECSNGIHFFITRIEAEEWE
jgi:hypothetical protein